MTQKKERRRTRRKKKRAWRKGFCWNNQLFFFFFFLAFEKKVSQLILDPAGIKKLSDTVLPNLSGSPQKIQTASLPIFPSFQHVFNAWRSQEEEEETKTGRPVESTHTGWLGINWTDLFKPFIFRDAPLRGTCLGLSSHKIFFLYLLATRWVQSTFSSHCPMSTFL